MTKRVLFVDDEPNILEGLRHRLRRQRRKWEMQFVQSGKEALEIMAREPIDVLVSDMRMPEMDGAELLQIAQGLYPDVVRIILSGHAELEAAMRALTVAHQFLSKPCEPGLLENIVERAYDLQSLINDQTVKEIVGRIEKLPSLPRIHSELMLTMSSKNVSNEEVTQILKKDMAICAKTLQVVNSAYFRLPRTISRMEEAVVFLGFDTIMQIVLAVEVFQYSESRLHPTMSLEVLQSHALLVASLASSFFTEKQDKGDAFTAGLLHDIGWLVLAAEMPDYIDNVLSEMKANQSWTMYEAEQHVYGATHAEIGGYLIGLWGLPYPIVEAVSNHHKPTRVDLEKFSILSATHIADGLVNGELFVGVENSRRNTSTIDLEYCKIIGVEEKLPEWQELARNHVICRS